MGRNTLCISRFQDDLRRKRCRRDVRGDLFSVSVILFFGQFLVTSQKKSPESLGAQGFQGYAAFFPLGSTLLVSAV